MVTRDLEAPSARLALLAKLVHRDLLDLVERLDQKELLVRRGVKEKREHLVPKEKRVAWVIKAFWVKKETRAERVTRETEEPSDKLVSQELRDPLDQSDQSGNPENQEFLL